MKPDDRKALIEYRLEQADRTLREAELLLEGKEWSGVVNRAYYAMFYAAMVLLLTKDLGSSKHSGVLSLLNREFVRPGLFPKEMSAMLRDAFDQRQKTDYKEFCPASETRAREIFANAIAFTKAIKEAIRHPLS